MTTASPAATSVSTRLPSEIYPRRLAAATVLLLLVVPFLTHSLLGRPEEQEAFLSQEMFFYFGFLLGQAAAVMVIINIVAGVLALPVSWAKKTRFRLVFYRFSGWLYILVLVILGFLGLRLVSVLL